MSDMQVCVLPYADKPKRSGLSPLYVYVYFARREPKGSLARSETAMKYSRATLQVYLE